MKDELTQLTELKQKISAAEVKTERAAGMLDQLLVTLKTDWDCSSLEEAKEKLRELTAQKERLSTKFKVEVKKFEEEWGDELRRLA